MKDYMKQIISGIIGALIIFWIVIWFGFSNNAETPAGYVGYVTQGSVLGKTTFINTQAGPTSTGKVWLAEVTNVSITPYTYDEVFKVDDGTSVLSKDHMQIGFAIHTVFQIRADEVKDFLEKYGDVQGNKSGDKIVKDAYDNFLAQRLRTFARDSIQQYNWQDLTGDIDTIGKQVEGKVLKLVKGTPFNVQSVVVGNIQFPQSVAQSVAEAQAASQILQRKEMEVKQAEADARKRVAEAHGVADAMAIVQQKLTPQYLQHEAIEAQKTMVGSPNHTTIYIPVGNMGVPLTGTFDVNPTFAKTIEDKK